MKRAFTLLIVILGIDLVSAQNLVLYQRPEYALTEYQKLYAENLVKDTKIYQLKGNVKSVTITLLERGFDSLTCKTTKMNKNKTYFETYKFEFLPNQKLQRYEAKWGQEYHENTIDIPKTTTKITNYYFYDESDKLLKIIESHSDSYGFHRKTTTEKDIDSSGFLKQEITFNIQDSRGKQIYNIKKYEWNKQRNAVNYHFNYFSRDSKKQGKLSFKGESYKKPSFTDTIISKGKLWSRFQTIAFDIQGNIIRQTSNEPDIRSSLPNNYNFSYKYNDDNELIEILKNGSTFMGFYHNEKTTFQYHNYDEHGNWQEMTISTTNKNDRNTKLKYKREILYY